MSPVEPGALGDLRPPGEFIDQGCVMLWCLSPRGMVRIPISSPTLVVSSEQTRTGGNKRLEMLDVLIRGLLFKIRSDWFRPTLS